MNSFTVASILTRVSSTADGGMGISFHTNELNAEEKVNVMGFHNKSGWLLFSPNPIEESDIPTKMAETGSKTASQRLRAVLFLIWDKSDKERTFDQFYADRMEMIIDKMKERLD